MFEIRTWGQVSEFASRAVPQLALSAPIHSKPRRTIARIVSDFTLSRQRENIAGVEVVIRCIGGSQIGLFTKVDVPQSLLRCRATTLCGHPRQLSSKGE